MKKVIFLAILPALFASCNKLDVTPVGSLTSSNFPKSDADAIALVNGAYVYNSQISTYTSYMTDLPSDEEKCGEAITSAGAPIGTYDHTPSNAIIYLAWTYLYQGATAANDVIDQVSAASGISSTIKARTINEAKFLRALYYFYIVRYWGDAPLVLHSTDSKTPVRSSVDAIYTQIVADLNDATALPAQADYTATSDLGRATKGAAYGLLAKVYLAWAQTGSTSAASARYQKAIDAANNVTGYSLTNDFLDNWDVSKRTNFTENIFKAGHVIGQFYTGDGFNHLAHCAFVTGFSQETPHLIVSDASLFYNTWDDRDQRKNGTYAKYLYNPTTGKVFTFDEPRYRKYIDTINVLTSATTRSIDRTILRYSDVLLSKAEAINELSGPTADAYDAINKVRRRAYKKTIDAQHLAADAFDYKNLTQPQFRDSLQKESLHEFTYEQQRWFNLVRWKNLQTTVKAVAAKSSIPLVKNKSQVSVKNYRFPIPQTERATNPNLTQNPGWDGGPDVSTLYDASHK
ncbi:MAG: RagB/SusD family nutrient uptake outer membrane protein [Bacteroidota bacterium]|nr:RagB/SusD family nutrient uptake outer membrane protein [Bacteroidota bacterium]